MTLEEAKEIVSEMYAENADKSAECACKYNDFETANYFNDRCKAIETVLKALEEQQKEIEEIEIENENLTLSQLDFTKRNISKDKIKEKIKDLQENNNGDNYSLVNVVNILKDILGEWIT